MRSLEGAVLGILVAAAMGTFSPPAEAQWAVACVNCSTSLAQITQLAHQVASLANQAQSLTYQVQNLTRMPTTVYSDVNGATGSLGGIVSSGQLMSGNINSAVSRLSSGAYPVGNYDALLGQLQTARTQMAGNVTNLQQLIGSQQNQATSDASTVSQLQSQASSTTGQQQAMNVSNEVQLQTAAQLIKLQQTQLSIAQEMATQDTLDNDRRASMDQQAAALAADPNSVCTTCGARY